MVIKGSFTPSDSVTNIILTGKIGVQPILSVTVSVKKIKGAARQRYGDSNGVVRCEQTLTVNDTLTGSCLRCLGGGGDDADLPVSAVLSRRAHHPAHRRGRPQGGRHRVVQTHTQMVAMDTSLPVCSALLLDDSRLLQGPQQVRDIFFITNSDIKIHLNLGRHFWKDFSKKCNSKNK